MTDTAVSSEAVIRILRQQLSDANFQIAILTARLEEGTMEGGGE